MKTSVNLTIDEELLSKIKAYAASKGASISELVEHYFKIVTKPPRHKNIIELVEKLGPPAINKQADLKEQFYQEQAKKYGF